jgi:hypothetical protein
MSEKDDITPEGYARIGFELLAKRNPDLARQLGDLPLDQVHALLVATDKAGREVLGTPRWMQLRQEVVDIAAVFQHRAFEERHPVFREIALERISLHMRADRYMAAVSRA